MKTTKLWALAGLALLSSGFIQQDTPALKAVFKNDFLIGAALNGSHTSGRNEKGVALVKKHFNTISPENVLKFGPLHPKENDYNWKPADDYVAFGEQNKMFIIGHTLIWHSQAPDWLFKDANGSQVSKEVLLKRMEDHITTVVGRYKGRIHGWDVLNEAINDEDGTLRKTKWLEILGEEGYAKAFALVHKIDPKTELYYNDYSLYRKDKREGTIRLVKGLQAKGIKVKAIGMQGHYGLTTPKLEEIEASILAFSKLGVEVNFTEFDIDVLPNPSRREGADIAQNFNFEEKYNVYKTGLPDSVQQQLTKRYADIFALFHKHRDKIGRITFWGVTDADSWLNNWPMRGRTSYPLLFDRNFQPKPAFEAVIKTAKVK